MHKDKVRLIIVGLDLNSWWVRLIRECRTVCNDKARGNHLPLFQTVQYGVHNAQLMLSFTTPGNAILRIRVEQAFATQVAMNRKTWRQMHPKRHTICRFESPEQCSRAMFLT